MLAELLDHRNLNVTRRYYRVGEAPPPRRRRHGDRAQLRPARQPDLARRRTRCWTPNTPATRSGEVAVPYGSCTEPSNVQAGGGACPVRFRCAGCDHFRTDVSHLPELTGYLEDLLRTRERLAATIDGVDEWARADATPTGEEITRIRRLINRITGDIAELPEPERTQIDDAVAVVRRHRAAHAVGLGMPTPARYHPGPGAGDRDRLGEPPHDSRSDRHHGHAAEPADPSDAPRPARRLRPPPPARPRRAQQRPPRAPRSASPAIARAAGVDRSFLYRHRDLLAQIHALQAEPPATAAATGPAVTRASLQADLLAAHERAARLNTRVQHLEKRLSEALGEHAWRESGLGTPTDIDALNQQITHLEQQVIDLRLQLAERDQDLAAARATNRELMARINARPPQQVNPRRPTCTTPVALDNL